MQEKVLISTHFLTFETQPKIWDVTPPQLVLLSARPGPAPLVASPAPPALTASFPAPWGGPGPEREGGAGEPRAMGRQRLRQEVAPGADQETEQQRRQAETQSGQC